MNSNTSKHITLMHNNDFHSQFHPALDSDMKFAGGIAALSSYFEAERKRNPDTYYFITGDMIDTGDVYSSILMYANTIQILNRMSPTAYSLGNHEISMGLQCIDMMKYFVKSPVLNANLIGKIRGAAVMQTGMIVQGDGYKFLVVGLIDRAIFPAFFQVKMDDYVNFYDNYTALEREISSYPEDAYDFAVLLTHNGLQADIELAERIPEAWKVKFILGGHDHIFMDEPVKVGDIYIAQSDFGTTLMGRFDFDYDICRSTVSNVVWKNVFMDVEKLEIDENYDDLETLLREKMYINNLTNQVLAEMKERYTHDKADAETPVGKLFSDIFADLYGADLAAVPINGISNETCPLQIRVSDLKKLWPYDGAVYLVKFTGAELKNLIAKMCEISPDGKAHGVLTFSRGLCYDAIISKYNDGRFQNVITESEMFNGSPVNDQDIFSVVLQEYTVNHFRIYYEMNLDIADRTKVRLVSMSSFHDLTKWFLNRDKVVELYDNTRVNLKVIYVDS